MGAEVSGGKAVAVGDVVYVHTRNDRRGMTREDRAQVVTRVGRKLVTIGEGWKTTQYRLDTQQSNDKYGHAWFRTVEQEDAADRRRSALVALRDAGLEVRPGHDSRLTTEQLEAVAVALQGQRESTTSEGGERGS